MELEIQTLDLLKSILNKFIIELVTIVSNTAIEGGFFMDLDIRQTEEVEREDISMRSIRSKKKVEERKFTVEKKELSKNIQKFDRPRVYTKNPYDYNSVVNNRVVNITPTASQMISNPLYNSVGKALGLDTTKEWNQHYDKVFKIAEWAKKKGAKNVVEFILDKSRTVPTMGARRIDDIYIYSQMT